MQNKFLAFMLVAAIGLIIAGMLSHPSHASGFFADVAKAITPPAIHPLIDGVDQTNGNLGRPLSGGY